MDIQTKTITTRVHTAVAKTADFKDVAILAAKRQLGLSDSAVVSADASVAEDGTISIEVVESVDTSVEQPKGYEADHEPDQRPDDAPSVKAPTPSVAGL